jgi:tellurite methyltransferase
MRRNEADTPVDTPADTPMDDAARWEARYSNPQRTGSRGASRFVEACLPLLPSCGQALDLAMGEGLNAVVLARHGYEVTGLDISPAAVELARQHAAAAGVTLHAQVADLTIYPLPAAAYDLIVVVCYLQRSLFEPIRDALRPGGYVLYHTYTRAHSRYSTMREAYLLAPGELLSHFAGLEIVRYDASDHPQLRQATASLLARKPSSR